MIPPSRRRWIAPALALGLAAGTLGALAAPASAATSTFTQPTKLFIGSDNFAPQNSAPITITDDGPATPYGSPIQVTHAGPITDVDVTLDGISHVYPDDIDVLLVGPGGQQVVLMSDAGGGESLSDKTLTFDDAAAASLPDTGVLISASRYKPTNYEATSDFFSAPAPSSTGNTSLAVFNGTSPVGAWNLYVEDDEEDVSGMIAGGWHLSIDQDTTAYPSTVDVSGLPTISDVDVKLTGITSTYLDDLDLLLVGPGGQQATILSDVGSGETISGVDLTIDDEAAGPLPDEALVTSGSYQPTNAGVTIDPYDAPAPVSTGTTALSAFDGLSPNGQWRLFAQDAFGGDVTSIDQWSLSFTWADTTAPTGTVAVNGGAASTSGTAVTLTLAATDAAPATGVTQMRFSNDGVTFSAYRPYAASAAWTLASGDGAKTVYAQFKDAEGNQSAVVSDAITLALPDTTAPTVTKTKPGNKAKGVKVDAKVKVTVSEALLASSVSKQSVFLKAKGSAKRVKATVTYNAAKKKIVVTPKKALEKHSTYKVTVSTGVKDAAGNAFDAKPAAGAQALTFSFTTA